MATSAAGIVPAQLGFLAIYNPSLGTTDETIDDQIVYYASAAQKRRHRSRVRPTDSVSQEERNERLRQIGLAQGIVEFSKSFSGGDLVDTIETEKSRVILHELEPSWWILVVKKNIRAPLMLNNTVYALLKLVPSLSTSRRSPPQPPLPRRLPRMLHTMRAPSTRPGR